MKWLKGWRTAVGGFLLGTGLTWSGLGLVKSCAERQPLAAAEVSRELAAKNIEDHHAEGQATRKAARARVTQEVRDAVRHTDLVDFLGSRAPR